MMMSLQSKFRSNRVSVADTLGSICSVDYVDLNSYDTDVVAMKDCKIFKKRDLGDAAVAIVTKGRILRYQGDL